MPESSATHVTLKLRDWSLLLLCNFIWASQFALVKLVQSEIGPLFTTMFPMVLVTVLLAPVVAWTRSRRSSRAPVSYHLGDVGAFMTIGIFGQVIAQLFATWGAQRSLASNAALL